MREYETVVIVQPEISEEGSKAILERLDGLLEKNGDIRLCCEDMGKRKLAYEIRKFHKGHYYILSYLGEGTGIEALERSLRLDESVLRFMTVVVSETVVDIEARKAAAQEFELDQEKRAAEKLAREAEDAAAREESERLAVEERAAAAAAAAAAPDPAEVGEGDEAAPDPAEVGEAPDAESTDALASDAAASAEEETASSDGDVAEEAAASDDTDANPEEVERA